VSACATEPAAGRAREVSPRVEGLPREDSFFWLRAAEHIQHRSHVLNASLPLAWCSLRSLARRSLTG
jgi:hypothetical protein